MRHITKEKDLHTRVLLSTGLEPSLKKKRPEELLKLEPLLPTPLRTAANNDQQQS